MRKPTTYERQRRKHLTHKVKTNVKPIRRKPAIHVPMAAGYTPAEEKDMQERKLALIEKHNQYLHGSNEYLRLIESDVRALTKSIEAFVAVMSTFVATVPAPAKRGRPAKAQEAAQEPAAAPPPFVPTPEVVQPTVVQQPLPPAPESTKEHMHSSVKVEPAKQVVVPTVDELRTKLLDFIAKNGRQAGLEALGVFGAKKVSDIPADQYTAFAASLG